MNSHPAIRASATLAVGGSSADRQLVGYLVSSGTDHPNRDELADFLGESLPEYLVPTRFVWLDELPLTAHGKIDREALAALDRDATDASVDEIRELPGDEPPRTPIQTAIASVLVELLGIPAIGLNENFFLLGGHSMLGAQLIVRLENLFDVEITLRYLFDHPTPVSYTHLDVYKRQRFVTNEGAKPSLIDSDLRFNASRSAGVALYATSWTTEVGVDIEQVRDIADVDGFAERFFSVAEQLSLIHI